MKILGIDPGLIVTGYGILESDGQSDNVELVEAGVLRIDRTNRFEKRLKELAGEIGEIIEQFKPDAVAVEDLYSHYGHPKTAIIMGHARGVIFLKAAEAGVKVFPYASTKIKNSLTGNGRATKAQMQSMIRSTFSLGALPSSADAADALAIALCHCRAISREETVTV